MESKFVRQLKRALSKSHQIDVDGLTNSSLEKIKYHVIRNVKAISTSAKERDYLKIPLTWATMNPEVLSNLTSELKTLGLKKFSFEGRYITISMKEIRRKLQ